MDGDEKITVKRMIRMIKRANEIMYGVAKTSEGIKFIGGTRGLDIRFARPPTKIEKSLLNDLFVAYGFTEMRFDRASDVAARIVPET